MRNKYPFDMAIRRGTAGNAVYLAEYRCKRVKGKVVTEFVRHVGKEDREKKVWYLNPRKESSETLRKIGYGRVFDKKKVA